MNLSRPRRALFLVVGLLLAAFALRLFRLDFQSIWWDEGISLHLGTSPWSEIVRDRLNNIHPPLYFFALKLWLSLVGVTPFAARYLSALASLVQVALVVAAAGYWSRRTFGWGGRRLGRHPLTWLATLLIALSPLSVIYGQEIRVYALLPVAYLTLLLLAERLLSDRPLSGRLLVYLALTEWLAVHLHYIALFGVAYVGLWGVVALGRARRWADLRRWVVAHALVAAASLPWFVAVLSNWAAVQAEANAGTFATEPVPLPFLFAQVWTFILTGLAGALADPLVRGLSLAAAVLSGALLLRLVVAGRASAAARGHAVLALRLGAHWAIPLLAAMLAWSVRSFSHPRYVVMYAIAFIPLAAALLWPGRSRAARILAPLLAACLLALSVWGLRQYFFDPGAAKANVRGVAHYLEGVSGPDDLILIPDTDWSFVFEYDGDTLVEMPHLDESPDDPAATLTRLLDCGPGAAACAASGRVFVVDYPRGTRDWQGRLPFELERRGVFLGETRVDELAVREYRLDARPGPLPGCPAPADGPARLSGARLGPLLLDSAWVEPRPEADGAVAVALCWRPAEAAAADLAASLVLTDALTGELVSQADTLLVDASGAPTSRWDTAADIVTYHVLPLREGTPPLDYDLTVGAYARDDAGLHPVEVRDANGLALGQQLPLGEVSLAQPAGSRLAGSDEAMSSLLSRPLPVADGLVLRAANAAAGPFRPGQSIRVHLLWEAGRDGLPDLRPALVLAQDEEVLARADDAPAQGRYPTNRWRAGETVLEARDLRVPPGAEGAARLSLVVDGTEYPLAEVAISPGDSQFEPPPTAYAADAVFGDAIRLAGYDAPSTVAAGAADVAVTLAWQALADEIPTAYTVFVHLLAPDGRVIAQHDGPPAAGQRPTTEWLAGEFITDRHVLQWNEAGYAGEATLAVGLYDPATGRRLTLADGGDALRLPGPVTVTAP